MKKTTFYSVYYIDTLKNDINFIEEFNNLDDLAEAYELKNKKSVYHYVIDNLDNVNLLELKNTLKNKYIIFKDVEVAE